MQCVWIYIHLLLYHSCPGILPVLACLTSFWFWILKFSVFSYPKTVVAVDSYPSWHCTSQARQQKELICFMCSGNSRYTKCSGKLLQSNHVGMVCLVCDQLSRIPVVIWCWWPLSQQWLYAVFPLSTSLQTQSQDTWTLKSWTPVLWAVSFPSLKRKHSSSQTLVKFTRRIRWLCNVERLV